MWHKNWSRLIKILEECMFNKPFRGQSMSRRIMLLVARIVTSVCACGKSDNCYLKLSF